jgi:hypothetical protein
MAEKQKAQYAAPGSQVDLERRQKNDNKSDRVLSTSDEYDPQELGEARSFLVEGNKVDQFIGTSPEYATYANETEAPLPIEGDENPEKVVFEQFAASPVPGVLKVDGNVEYEGEKKQREDAAKASEEARAEGTDTGADSSADTTGEDTEAAKKATAPKPGN